MENKKKRNSSLLKKRVIIIAAVAAVLLGGFLAAGAFLPKDKIANNVMAGSIDLGGLTLAQAEREISMANPFSGKTIAITSNGLNTEFSAEDIELGLDAHATAQKAFDIGKSKNIFKNSCDFFRLLFGRADVGYTPSVNSRVLDEILYLFGTTFNGEFEDYKITVEDDGVSVAPRTPGQDPDTVEARNQILKSVEQGIFSGIDVTLKKSDTSPITKEDLYDKLYALPMDAEYVYEGDEIKVKEHVVGIEVDKEELSEPARLLNNNQTAHINAKVVMPSKTTEVLKSKLFNATLASYSTTYSTGAANRASNVALAASKINGTILKPGDTFSYNETIGDTTIANGYKVAPVFENGKTSEGVGGGVCQVSSTLYSAVLYADLKVVERRNHSLTVAYVPKGQDATVSYGAIDFKFANDTDYPIKIAASTGGGTVTVSIIGTKYEPERTVKLSHSIVSTIQPVTNETNDANLPAGTRKVTTAGKTGYVVDTYKTVYENGKEISSSKITRSSYRMTPTEVTVGTKEEAPVYVVPSPAPTDSLTDTPTASPTEAPAAQTAAPTEQPPVRPTAAPLAEPTEEVIE